MAHNSMLINVGIGETRVALVEDGVVGELHVERRQDRSPVGNVYLGRVTRVLPGMQAAFIDIGLDRAAFLHVEDLIREDVPAADTEKLKASQKRKKLREKPIRELIKEGSSVLVQVSKGPIGTKGARVTGHVALAGRYVAYTPHNETVGVSKRIGNDKERKQLSDVLKTLKPEKGGLILRAAGTALTKNLLENDITFLTDAWASILEKKKALSNRKKPKVPSRLYEEPGLVLRAARDLFRENINEIVIDNEENHAELLEVAERYFPTRKEDIRYYDAREPLFDEFGVEAEIARALARKVNLPSGGYLIIDQAEALTAVDVNTGRFTGRGKNVADTILQTNIEAAREIAYQLRFRNIGGLLVLDFIDMERKAHRDKVYRELVNGLKKDHAKTTTVRISDLGLVEMTRKRTRDSLGRTVYEPCFYCDGTGRLRSKATVCQDIFRQLRREQDLLPGYEIHIAAHPAVCDMLKSEEKESLAAMSNRLQRRIELVSRSDYHLEQFDLSAS